MHGTPCGKQENTVDIIISNASARPIYEQIASQVKGLIADGTLVEGAQLPSIRSLANDLHVSVITTKRAYADLEAEGYIETMQGRGSFVASGNAELLRTERLRSMEEHLEAAVREGRLAGVGKEELHERLDALWNA